MLSQRGRYALKALIYLARAEQSGELRTVASIAAQERIPRKFLESILMDLKRARLLESQRGYVGGYRLAREAASITFAEVMRATDGPLALVPCVSRHSYRRCADCVDEATCAIRRVLAQVRDQVGDILDNTSLESAASGRFSAPEVRA